MSSKTTNNLKLHFSYFEILFVKSKQLDNEHAATYEQRHLILKRFFFFTTNRYKFVNVEDVSHTHVSTLHETFQ